VLYCLVVLCWFTVFHWFAADELIKNNDIRDMKYTFCYLSLTFHPLCSTHALSVAIGCAKGCMGARNLPEIFFQVGLNVR